MFFSSRIHRRSPRRLGALMISGALVASFAGLAVANPASATHVDGVEYAGNLDCAALEPDGVEWEEFKIDGVPSADKSPYKPGGELEITISKASSQTFDWASNFDMAAVLVKGGPLGDQGGGGVHYDYPGTDDGADTGLHALPHATNENEYHGISHVTFCYLAGSVPTTTTSTTATTTTLPSLTPETTPTETAVAPQVVVTPEAQPQTAVLGETLVQDATLPRTGAAATPTLVLVGGLGLAFGLLMLTLARRRTAVSST